MRLSNSSPKVNAGSMADIAFLLLIFFLVTTTMTKDEGINRTLPKDCPPNQNCVNNIPERNLFQILLNAKEEIMVNNEQIEIHNLKPLLKEFIDNNGDGSCAYCLGNKNILLSDNPKEAIISLKTDRLVSYNRYIEIQNEITKAYYDLRMTYSLGQFNKPEISLTKEEISSIMSAYPFKISEVNR